MRFTTALPVLAIAPAATTAFHVGTPSSNPSPITSTTLEARRLLVPMVRRRPTSSMFFPDIDRMFQEMDEMMESSFSGLSRRPSSMLAFEKFPQAQGLGLRQTLGIEVSQDENEFKVSINLSDVEAKDLDLQLDSDGRVLRLKGQKVQEESGMKIKSSYEKAILLHPDVDTDKISASFSDGVLSIVAPKVEKKEDLEEKKPKKIDIHVEANAEEPTAVVTDDAASHQVESPKASTRLAIENMTNEKAEVKKTTDYAVGEKKWPARDFPY